MRDLIDRELAHEDLRNLVEAQSEHNRLNQLMHLLRTRALVEYGLDDLSDSTSKAAAEHRNRPAVRNQDLYPLLHRLVSLLVLAASWLPMATRTPPAFGRCVRPVMPVPDLGKSSFRLRSWFRRCLVTPSASTGPRKTGRLPQ